MSLIIGWAVRGCCCDGCFMSVGLCTQMNLVGIDGLDSAQKAPGTAALQLTQRGAIYRLLYQGPLTPTNTHRIHSIPPYSCTHNSFFSLSLSLSLFLFLFSLSPTLSLLTCSYGPLHYVPTVATAPRSSF